MDSLGFDYRLLFSKIDVKNLMILLNAVLTERHIILINDDAGDNSIIFETIFKLIYPFVSSLISRNGTSSRFRSFLETHWSLCTLPLHT